MIYFVDFENVTSQGLVGIENLGEDDCVKILYSDKAYNISMDFISIFQKAKCKIDLFKMEKTAPNYLDVQLICGVANAFFTQDEKECAIISEDKCFISARDYFAKLDKQVYLALTIEQAFYVANKTVQADKKCIAVVKTPIKKITEEPNNEKTTAEKLGCLIKQPSFLLKEETITGKIAEDKIPNDVMLQKVLDTNAGKHIGRNLTKTDKDEIKELLGKLPKMNGKLHEVVYREMEKCHTLGEYRFVLVNQLGSGNGEKAYMRTVEKFKDFKGIS